MINKIDIARNDIPGLEKFVTEAGKQFRKNKLFLWRWLSLLKPRVQRMRENPINSSALYNCDVGRSSEYIQQAFTIT